MYEFNKTQQQMFALLRSSLFGVDRFPVQIFEDVDWESVYLELKDQSVNRVVADVLCKLNTPVSQQCLMDTTYGISSWHSLMREQQYLHDLLLANNIKYVVLKGASACINYPMPVYRSMGDIDIIVAPDSFDKAIVVMRDNGYSMGEDDNHQRHVQMFRNGIEVEVHRYYSIFSNKNIFEYFESMLISALDKVSVEDIEGYKFNMLPPCENGLVILEHIDHHLRSGIGLRQIIDWMLFVDRHVTDPMWDNIIGPETKKIGLDRLAVVVTRMCQMYLGLRQDITWCKDVDEDLCNDLMHIILNKGNFGHKEKDRNRISIVLHASSGIKGTLRMLQYRGTVNWKALDSNPWLTPFAWMYQMCRYIRKGFRIKNPFRSLVKQAKSISQERDVYDKLGVTNRSEGIETPNGKQY